MIGSRTLSLVGAAIGAALLLVPQATAQPRDAGIAGGHAGPAKPLTGASLAQYAGRDPFQCDFDRDGQWGPKQNACIVRVVFRTEPRVAAEAERIITCESGWDEHQITPPYAAGGLAQFLPSTFHNTPYGRHSRLNPVWNVKAMRWLYHHDGDSFREWTCAYILGIN